MESFRALAHWPELADIAALLQERYPDPVPGFHRVHFEEWGVILTLAIGEAGEMLSAVDGRFDAWFLDGFAPSRNPDMWRPEVLSGIGRATVDGGTLATFTSAGTVRRGLAAAGFKVAKIPGYGRKREMSVARKIAAAEEEHPRRRLARHAGPITETARTSSIAIVGAGIAGASLAYALRRRGVTPVLFDKVGLGDGASGNSRALVMPRLDAGDNSAARFHAAAYTHAIREYRRSPAWDACGALAMLPSEAECLRAAKARDMEWHPAHKARAMTEAEATEVAGLSVGMPGLFYSGAGLLTTRHILQEWTEACEIRIAEVAALERRPEGGRLLCAPDGTKLGQFDVVILASGASVSAFPEVDWIPLAPVRGQLSVFPPSALSAALRPVLSWGGYLSPVRDGVQMLGATHESFNRIGEDWGVAVLDEDHLRNYANLPDILRHALPEPSSVWSGRARLRAVTPDRMPVFGAVPDADVLRSYFSGRPRHSNLELPGSDLLVFGGFGSRGYVTAPLAAEILVSRLFGEVWPVAEELAFAGDPCRFVTRAYRHGKIGEFFGSNAIL